jgi:hypothetical protein
VTRALAGYLAHLLRRAAPGVAGTGAAFVIAFAALAQDAPLPDFYWPYGQVQVDGSNIEPPAQPVIAIVRGQACGSSTTLVAQPGPETPAADANKTVYVVNVRADGTGGGQRPGCGRPGDPVLFYFPILRRFATTMPLFRQGEERVNLSLGPPMTTRLPLPFVSDDGPP